MTEENHYILIYILDDCSFSIMITFFFISKRKVFDYQTVYSNSNLFIIKRSLPITKYRKTNCSPCNNFDGFTRNGTLWDEYFIQKKHTVFFLELEEIFHWNPQHQFWLIYTEWHIMEWLFYTYKPSVFYLNFWKFPGTSLIDLHGISHEINILYSKRHIV